MTLREYFENTSGTGILATADKDGRVNAAIYGRPYVTNDGQVAFIMADRRTRANLQSNPQAAYLFKEDQTGYKGKRLVLTKTREERNEELIRQLSRRTSLPEVLDRVGDLYLVYFRLDEERPLLGNGAQA